MPAILLVSLIQAWQCGAPMPVPAYGFACGVVGNRVYAIGGRKFERGNIVPRNAVEAYDAERDSWIVGYPPMPFPRWYAACAVLDDKIYVIGGTDGQFDSRRVDRFDPATNRWDTVASLPWGRQAAGACVYQGQIYVVGGFHQYYYYRKSVARFVPSPGPGSWQIVDSLNMARSSVGVGVVGDRIYALGGRFFNPLTTVEHYTPNEWVSDSLRMTVKRAGLGVVACSTFLIAIGGDSTMEPQNSVEMMECSSGRWFLTEPLTSARSYMGAARVGDRVFVIGGRGTHGTVLASVERNVLPLPGIEEVPQTLPEFRTGFSQIVSRVLTVEQTGRLEVRDAAGRLKIRVGSPVSAELPAGIYFVRLTDSEGRVRTGRVLVAR